MGRELLTELELPDLSTGVPAAPASGKMYMVGRNKRPVARNSDGRIFDLGNIVESVRIGGAAVDPVRIECISGTSDANGDLTINFANTYASAPRITLTATATSGTQPTLAELVSVSTTQAVIRTYRTKTQGVLLGGTINPTERVSTTVQLMAIGVLA